MTYRKQIRRTRAELEEELDLPEGDVLNKVKVIWDNIGQEWVFDYLIEQAYSMSEKNYYLSDGIR